MDQTMHYRYPPLSGETPNTHDQLSAISTLHGIRRLSPETWKNKEALSVLEELDRVSFNNVATPLLRNKDNIEEYKVRVARMLSNAVIRPEINRKPSNRQTGLTPYNPIMPKSK